jgi:TldD protein
MQQLLERIAAEAEDWTELRFQARQTRTLTVRNGLLESSTSVRLKGVGARVLALGVFGFASTTDLTERGIRAAVAAARSAARTSAAAKRDRVDRLASASLARGVFPVDTRDPLDAHPLEEKLALALETEAHVRAASAKIVSAAATYDEIQDEKILVTSDGASAHIFDSKPSFRVLAVARDSGDQSLGYDTVGVTGGWADLFAARTTDELVDNAVRLAVDPLSAPQPEGGTVPVVLDPELVGLLCHEAIGHTVEADIVLGGAVTADKIGQRVASELVTMCDSGLSPYDLHAVGTLPVDDEGVVTGRTVLIERGVLRSYLHNRETAAHYGVAPTGNARAFVYSDNPIIRMRNTYIEPGEHEVGALFAGIRRGYYLKGFAMSGQADSNAEFMFGVREARRIVDGHVGQLVRGATISGNAFRVLESVDAVGNDFAWEKGAGACGKGQAAKVDSGGPHIRCTLTIGGRQE